MKKRALSIFLLALLCALIASIIVLSLVPPVSKDELVHHLAVPKLYLKHGGMYEIPFMPFSYYPMNLDLLYLIPLYFGNDIVPKFVHFAFALLTAWLIFRYLKKRTAAVYALFGALFFLSIPIIVKLSITAYVDLGVVFFSFASLFLLFMWAEKGFKWRFLILSGIAAGLAMGTKYNALITTALLTLFVPIVSARQGERSFFRPARHALLFLLVALLVFSPWMARDYAWKQNPVYPLFGRAFNLLKNEGSQNEASQTSYVRSGPGIFVIREGIYHEAWWEIALVPFRIFFEGEDGSPKHFDGKINPFLLFFSVFAFWRMREDEENLRNEKKVMLLFVFLFFAVAFFTSDFRIRYIGPIIPVLVVLSVMGAEKLHRSIGKAKAGGRQRLALVLFGVAFASALAYNGRYVAVQFKEVEPFGYITGAVTRGEYLEKRRPEYPAMRFINEHLPRDAKVMLLFMGDRGYYLDREYILGEGFLGTFFRGSTPPDSILAGLQREKVTHLLINDPFFQRWARENLSDAEKSHLREFFGKYGRVLFNRGGFYVLGLLNPRD